jgi:hypothetical protein
LNFFYAKNGKDSYNTTGKNVYKEKDDKIVSVVINDKIPKNMDKIF